MCFVLPWKILFFRVKMSAIKSSIAISLSLSSKVPETSEGWRDGDSNDVRREVDGIEFQFDGLSRKELQHFSLDLSHKSAASFHLSLKTSSDVASNSQAVFENQTIAVGATAMTQQRYRKASECLDAIGKLNNASQDRRKSSKEKIRTTFIERQEVPRKLPTENDDESANF